MNDPGKRTGSVLVRVVDSEGQAIRETELAFEQKTHDFLFGCGAFDSLPYANDRRDDPFFADRMEKWLAVYNYGTIPFYWGGYEPREGEPAYESRMNAAKFLVSRGVTVKGHPLCWHTSCADWLMAYDAHTILDKQLERIHREVTAFKGVIGLWDVINEVVIMPVFDKYDNAITRICKEYGRVNLVKEVFAAAKAADPDAVLLINDFNLSEKYAELIGQCLEAGVPIGAIGLQTHQHQGYMGTEKLEEIIRRFEPFSLPLHFTENTLVSGHIMPGHIVDLNDYQIPEWPTTPEGEERQKRELEEMVRFLFDHPQVEAVTGWDFTDGAWLGAPSGVLRRDNSVKPSYEMLKKLIHEEWHSKGTVRTDAEGMARIAGYAGSYEIRDAGRKAAVHIGRETEDAPVAARLT